VKLAAALTVVFLAARLSGGAPPVLIRNGRVIARAGARPAAEALVLAGGKIVFVGSEPEARRKFPGARLLDARGGFIYPGFADAHGHLWELGQNLETADLKGAPSARACAERMLQISRSLPATAWALGFGWDQNLWPERAFPDAATLDVAFPERPAAARRIDGHAVWANSAAMRAAGVTKATPDVAGGKIVRRPDGTPSGVFLDNAADLITAAEPAPTEADMHRRLQRAMETCASVGLTEVGDASGDTPGYDETYLPVLRRMARAGELPIRVYATVGGHDPRLDQYFRKGPVTLGRLQIRAVKLYADGALGSRGAALLEDYADDPGNRGFFVTPPAKMREIVEKCFRAGFQPWIHAIGDAANRAALDAYEAAEEMIQPKDARPRIEHAQVVTIGDRPRFAKLGVIASIQPTFATSDMGWALARLGPGRLAESYAWRSLERAGARLAGGSDFPIESHDPLRGIFAAVTREAPDGSPREGWRPVEDLSRRDAIALYTTGAAYAMFQETVRGEIATGRDADLTVLDRDLMDGPASEIPNAKVLLTIVGGDVAFLGP
jgi:predicted amidohydrolase YtcJ